jgi:signal transduction histidine kinase
VAPRPTQYRGVVADFSATHSVFDWRPRQGELIALDCLAAAVLTGLFFVLSNTQVPLPLRIAVVGGMALPVAARRLWPVPVFGFVAVVSLLSAVFGVVREPFLAAAFALYWVAATTPRTRWIPTGKIAVASVAVLLAGVLMGSPGWEANGLVVQLMGVALAGMAWTIGRAVHERRMYVARSARQLAARAVAEERLRIARELHDIVAHNIGVIAVKAGVANHVLPLRPQEAGEALRVIEVVSRTALAEMRHMLGVLRSGGSADDGADPLPAPGLSGLPDLVERAVTAGVAVDLHIRDVAGLPEGVDRSAYRIVQEALTNVMRHAAPTRCRVAVEADGSELRIDVADEGTNAPRPGTPEGHGLVGMRERVALYGGELRAGPRPEGGFAVSARLPY